MHQSASILVASLLSAVPLRAQGGELVWHDARELTVEGKGWPDTAAPYDRLPASAERQVREAVWRLSRHSAGLAIRFASDAPALHARWTLRNDTLATPHMAATAVSGLDLYAKDAGGRWRWMAVGMPPREAEGAHPTLLAPLVVALAPERREYLLYLPLYNGVTSVEIGVPRGSVVEAAPPRAAKPIVFYGTSITQGACASRPGMTHAAMLGRRLGRPVINLGFSGKGEMEPEVAALLAQLDPALYVLDCLPNMDPAEIRQRVVPFVETLRRARPATPILLVEDRSYQDGAWIEGRRTHNRDNRAALRAEFDGLVGRGTAHLHYLFGADLLGDDGEATVDGSHPTDLGFSRLADAFEPVLRGLVGPPPK